MEVFALLFSPSPKQDDEEKKALRKTLQHPLWAQKLYFIPESSGCPDSLRGGRRCTIRGPAALHCGAVGPGPRPTSGLLLLYQLSPSLPLVVNPLPKRDPILP